LRPHTLAQLLKRIADGTISGKIAKDVFDAMWAGEGDPDAIIDKRGLRQISDEGAIEKIVDDAIAGQSCDRRGVQARQGEGVQLARRQGDGRVQGQGQSVAGELRSSSAELG
jgi:Asp-tRNA(Asn)/Glu-tRNA(Gln) amidotransferase B subunit